jgi:hypothetical protein
MARSPAGDDPGRARQLLDEAERLADQVSHFPPSWELAELVRTVATLSPAEAIGLVTRIPGSLARVGPLATIASRVFEDEPERARDLFHHAVEAANGLPAERDRRASLTQLAVLMRDSDPGGAAELAGTVAKDAESDWERSQAAIALAGARPDRAARLIEEIGDDAFRGMALAELARSLAETDPRLARTTLDRAMATIPLVSSDDRPGQALAGAALSVAHGDAAAALQYLDAVPEDAGRHIVQGHLAGAVLPDGSGRSADALAGYLLGSGRGNDPTGHLGTGGWTLPSTLQFVNGFLTALATSTPARAPAVAQEVAGVLERYWPAIP